MKKKLGIILVIVISIILIILLIYYQKNHKNDVVQNRTLNCALNMSDYYSFDGMIPLSVISVNYTNNEITSYNIGYELLITDNTNNLSEDDIKTGLESLLNDLSTELDISSDHYVISTDKLSDTTYESLMGIKVNELTDEEKNKLTLLDYSSEKSTFESEGFTCK